MGRLGPVLIIGLLAIAGLYYMQSGAPDAGGAGDIAGNAVGDIKPPGPNDVADAGESGAGFVATYAWALVPLAAAAAAIALWRGMSGRARLILIAVVAIVATVIITGQG